MSADILPFPPVRAKSAPPVPDRRCVPGDIIVTCINATYGLWCAWPVAAVDDDGVVVTVQARDGRRIAAERLSCEPVTFGLAAADHEDLGFRALCWQTWSDFTEALTAFAAISKVAPR